MSGECRVREAMALRTDGGIRILYKVRNLCGNVCEIFAIYNIQTKANIFAILCLTPLSRMASYRSA